MAIERQTVTYDGPGGPFAGVAAWDVAVDGRRPGVLVIPNILGQKEADNHVAERLAGLGYAALACDLFGQGKRTERGRPDTSRYMDELNADRGLLRDRLAASLAALRALPVVDGERCAAIGFCFGGKAALDMARAGLAVRGVVSLHGLYDAPPYDDMTPIATKILVCHGWEDRLAPPEAVVRLGQELTKAGADWQLLAHGHAGHAFTDRELPKTPEGFGYDPNADRRSWEAVVRFLGEVLG
ncbi:dienelactone hydrolase [Sphingomonas metalli]|uniref:Dienelactone hydrolase n=1 Tax=Sphingomonas metalli TaxID=1779358 RepID=A0A916TDN1_9SPHN|nr:dienelactone hydrolase family protein [Sphingomonas metalli]GGB39474.1 dienelactone hydrolase [Sphingomonas metalli]